MKNQPSMQLSSQAIVVDRDRKIYLEVNKKLNCLSFIGGKVEEGEDFETALIREMKEEISIILTDTRRLLDGREQAPTNFSTRLWHSKYFVFVLEDIEKNFLSKKKNIEVFTFDQLICRDDFSIHKHRFLGEVQRALSHLI